MERIAESDITAMTSLSKLSRAFPSFLWEISGSGHRD
jgi:hypothetical protein